jgi:3-oxoacyl-[acyl-carrier protein] reductase
MINIDLSHRTALVTGGARGIGAATCRVLAKAGARVAILTRNADESRRNAEELASEITAAGGAALALAANVEQFDQVEQAVRSVADQWGPIDILVTSAGTTSRFTVDQLSPEEWHRIVEINLSGTFHSVKAALPHLRRQRGTITLIGSAAIVAGSGGGVHYAASKAALEGLCRGLTRELAPQGIRTNLVHPSLIDTDLLRFRHPDPVLRQQLANEVPLRRLGEPEDIANLVAFLASDLAGYITGQSFYVDGGRTFCK